MLSIFCGVALALALTWLLVFWGGHEVCTLCGQFKWTLAVWRESVIVKFPYTECKVVQLCTRCRRSFWRLPEIT